MQKNFCDVCEKEISGHINRFEYLCHLDNINRVDGYSDAEGNAISQRSVCTDLCNRCYNTIVSKAVQRLKELKTFNECSTQ